MSHQSVQHEIMAGLHLFGRALVPRPEDRIPVSSHTFLVAIPLHVLPLVFMSYLARRPDTYPIRLLLLPITVVCCIHLGFGYQYLHPMLNVYNFGLALFSEAALSRAILFALTPEGMLKRNEIAPNVRAPAQETHEPPAITLPNGEVEVSFDLRKKPSSSLGQSSETLGIALKDALELLSTMRGIDFKAFKGTSLPSPTRPQSPPSAFLKATLKSFIYNFLILDFLEALLKLVPGVGDPSGGSMFLDSLTPVPRYALATIVHFMTGVCILSGFQMVYDLITLVAVGLIGISPQKYPPVMDHPFTAESLHEYWAKRWHQLLRMTFIALGGWPTSFLLSLPFCVLPKTKTLRKAAKVTKDLGLLFGTFLASGLFHETSIYSMGHGIDLCGPTVLFFAAQGPLLILERVWRVVTGRRVSGWLGTAWVWLVIVGGGQGMIDSWHQRGLGGGMVIFPFISPTRLLLLPLLQRIIALLPS